MAQRALIRKIVPARTAFLLCDLQTAFKPAIWNFDDVAATANKMLKFAQFFGIPVIATEQNPKALGSLIPDLQLEPLKAAGLHVGTFPKKKFSMMIPEVEEALAARGVQDIVLFGIESHICVLQTTLDLLNKSYDVHVLADGISSCNKGERGIAIETMRQAGARISTSESIIYQLLDDASDPRFRAFANLVKDETPNTKQSTANLLESL